MNRVHNPRRRAKNISPFPPSTMQLPTWRKVFSLTNSLIPALSQPNSKANFVAFHSTPATCEKWKNKWKSKLVRINLPPTEQNGGTRFGPYNTDLLARSCAPREMMFDNQCILQEVKRTQKPSKSHIKYATRQKRADTKRALRDLLFNSGAPKNSFQDEEQIWRFDDETENQDVDGCDKKQKSKLSSRRGGKFHNKKMKRNHRRERFSDEFDLPENIFQATFGNRWYTWSFRGDTPKSSTFGFEWRERLDGEYQTSKLWENVSDAESEDEEVTVGSHSDRTVLGLPPTGPLKMEDVKNAFRLSALKWHPDKHQGASQAAAEEKFKLCVNAYKSLCAALT